MRSCLKCPLHDNCLVVLQVCKQMVFRLKEMDLSFLEHTASSCKNYPKQKKVKEIPSQLQLGGL